MLSQKYYPTPDLSGLRVGSVLIRAIELTMNSAHRQYHYRAVLLGPMLA